MDSDFIEVIERGMAAPGDALDSHLANLEENLLIRREESMKIVRLKSA